MKPLTVRRSSRLGSRIALTTAAAGALALGGTPIAAAAPTAPSTTANHEFTHGCSATIDGQKLRVKLTVTFTGPRSNDVKRVTVRATDNNESGVFRNSAVNLYRARIKVNGSKGTRVNRTSSSSPFSTSLDPNSRSSGRDVISVVTQATFTIDGHRTVPLTCFFIDE